VHKHNIQHNQRLMLNELIEGIGSGLFAWFWFCVFTAPGNIGEPIYNGLEWMQRNGMKMLAKPLGLCGQCFSGQVGLWWYVVKTDLSGDWSGGMVFVAQTVFVFTLAKKYAD